MSARRRTKGVGGDDRAALAWKIVAGAVVLAAIFFAVQGGEYATTDLFRQRAKKARLMAEIDALQREVDSLARVKRSIQMDPAVQERIAREEFGMIRGNKEILYRFAEPADTGGKARP